MATSDNLTIGIVGAGVMGRGIAQIAAEAGINVVLADVRPEAVEEAIVFCRSMLQRKLDKGRLSQQEFDTMTSRLKGTAIKDPSALALCDLVIEAVAERLDIKHDVLKMLEESVSDDCVIATNTSSLSVTQFASAARLPGRVAGFHFFNPVPLMNVVEVIGGVMTEEATLDFLVEIASRMGHHPVRAADTPGFLVNHAGRAYVTEALRIVSEGICDFAEVDRIMVEAAGFPMGPFELLDLTGLDVSHSVMESIYHQFYEDPRYRPSPIAAQRKAAGLFGRKTGRGFYRYEAGKKVGPALQPVDAAIDPSALTVWLPPSLSDADAQLVRLIRATGARIDSGVTPSQQAIIVLAPIGNDVTTTATRAGLDPRRCVGVDTVNALNGRITLMRNPVTEAAVVHQAKGLLGFNGTPVSVINDSPGFVAQRILASIVNLGADIAQQRIAVPRDIDCAVELGLGYPKGPLALGDHMGAPVALAILEACQTFYGDPRYRPSPWLKRCASLGISLLTPQGYFGQVSISQSREGASGSHLTDPVR